MTRDHRDALGVAVGVDVQEVLDIAETQVAEEDGRLRLLADAHGVRRPLGAELTPLQQQRPEPPVLRDREGLKLGVVDEPAPGVGLAEGDEAAQLRGPGATVSITEHCNGFHSLSMP